MIWLTTASFMRLRRKLRTFLAMSRPDRLLVCEAILALAVGRLIVLTIPIRLMAPWLSGTAVAGAGDEALLSRVRQAVTTAARNVPWKAVCFPQALAAKAMLARRGQGSSLHLGAGFDGQGKLIAHAWLVAGETIVVGAAGISSVSPLARFS
jgi:Transglutaminase-like superfamily